MPWVVEDRCITIIKYHILLMIKCDQRYVSQVLYVGIIPIDIIVTLEIMVLHMRVLGVIADG